MARKILFKIAYDECRTIAVFETKRMSENEWEGLPLLHSLLLPCNNHVKLGKLADPVVMDGFIADGLVETRMYKP